MTETQRKPAVMRSSVIFASILALFAAALVALGGVAQAAPSLDIPTGSSTAMEPEGESAEDGANGAAGKADETKGGKGKGKGSGKGKGQGKGSAAEKNGSSQGINHAQDDDDDEDDHDDD